MLALTFLALATFVPMLHEGDTVPALPLVDQSGHAFSLQSLRGNAVVVSFIYTRCGDARMCPLVAAKFGRMQRAIGTDPVRLVALTLDPAYDTPAVLRRYGAGYRQDASRWILGTGAPESIDELATRFGIATSRTLPGQVVHTEVAVVLDREGRVARIVDGNAWTPNEMLALVRDAAGVGPAPTAIGTVRLWLTTAVALCGGGRASFNGLAVLGVLAAMTVATGLAFARALK